MVDSSLAVHIGTLGARKGEIVVNMGPSKKEICIKCDEGGDVLACADSSCPIAVHVMCMDCPARFDDSGKFYCPYCLYRKTDANFHQVKEHLPLKKQALRTFLDKEMIGNNKEVASMVRKSTCERANEPLPEEKNEVPQSNSDQQRVVGQQIQKRKRVDEPLLEEENDVQQSHSDQQRVVEQQIQKRKSAGESLVEEKNDIPQSHDDQRQVVGQQIHSGPVDTSKVIATEFGVLETVNSVRVNDPQEIGEDHNQNGHLGNSGVVEEEKSGNELVHAETTRNSVEIAGKQKIGVDETTSTSTNADPSLQQPLKGKRTGVSTSKHASTQLKKAGDKHVVTDSPRRLPRTSTSLLENSNVKGKLVQVKQPSMLLPVQLPSGRRQPVSWHPEEEAMLEEGVKKFSTTTNKNIPWRKILEFGGYVFDPGRTPTDLKDKWKKICSKYGGRV